MTSSPGSGIIKVVSGFGVENNEKFRERWVRILACAGVKTDSALARVLDILPQSVTAARKRGQIPSGWIEKLSEQYGVSADWLFFGRGAMRPGSMPDAATGTDAGLADTGLQALPFTNVRLVKELNLEREERRQLTVENRTLHREKEALYREKEELLRENGKLREKVARLEERRERFPLSTGQPEEKSGTEA